MPAQQLAKNFILVFGFCRRIIKRDKSEFIINFGEIIVAIIFM